MTQEEIRALDGPTLSKVAWQLGLAPKEVGTIGHKILAYLTALTVPHEPWHPHLNLAQADAVFRQLRARGWYCGAAWSPLLHGVVNAYRPHEGRSSHVVCQYGAPGQDSEALALLRCAVLAVASTPEVPHA